MQLESKHVLVVGGETPSVNRIRTLLSSAPGPWGLLHAADANSAHAQLESYPEIAALLCDPEVRGLASPNLLGEVRSRFPAVVRLSFSSRPEIAQGAVSRALALHALPENTGQEELLALLARTSDVHRLISSQAVAEVVHGLDRLPPLPNAYHELAALVSRSAVDFREVAALIESDPIMTLKVLQLVNSAFFGLRQRVGSINQALNFLGLEVLKGLFLTVHVAGSFETTELGFSLEQFQRYSMRVGRLAQRFASRWQLAEEALTLGLLHDIGELVFALQRPEEFGQVTHRMTLTGESATAVETALLGASHAEVGARLLADWGLPFSVVECVTYHHRPRSMTGADCQLLATLHAADALVAILTCGESEEVLDTSFLERAGAGDALADWRCDAEIQAKLWAAHA
jgi:HD-like signal output (HDOD) protein